MRVHACVYEKESEKSTIELARGLPLSSLIFFFVILLIRVSAYPTVLSFSCSLEENARQS